jgi:hypothetical protein
MNSIMRLPASSNAASTDYFQSLANIGLPQTSFSLANFEPNIVAGVNVPDAVIASVSGATGNQGVLGNLWQGVKDFGTGIKTDFDALPTFGGVDANGNKTMGKAELGLGALSAGINAFMGMKNYGLAKKQFNFQKAAWEREFAAQKGLTNAQLSDRQNRRNAEAGNIQALTGVSVNPQDTASYMAKYGVK